MWLCKVKNRWLFYLKSFIIEVSQGPKYPSEATDLSGGIYLLKFNNRKLEECVKYVQS